MWKILKRYLRLGVVAGVQEGQKGNQETMIKNREAGICLSHRKSHLNKTGKLLRFKFEELGLISICCSGDVLIFLFYGLHNGFRAKENTSGYWIEIDRDITKKRRGHVPNGRAWGKRQQTSVRKINIWKILAYGYLLEASDCLLDPINMSKEVPVMN